ncbi:MAG: hypothetical protein H7124_05205 [Phycisphaerales bacterium]|nr:hypothetical protein [Hyphomonadaceae bacterium]
MAQEAVVIAWLAEFGIPLTLAILPGLFAVGGGRRVLGVTLLAGAAAVVVGPPLAQHLAIQAALDRGESVVLGDDIAFLFVPTIFAAAYALLACFVWALFVVCRRLLGREPLRV